MSAWSGLFAVNGALIDSLVTDFGGALSNNTALPAESRLCLVFHFSCDTPTTVQLYLAYNAGASPEELTMIYDSALQTNPGPNQTDYLTNIVVDVPINPNTRRPKSLRISKAAGDAFIEFSSAVRMGPGC